MNEYKFMNICQINLSKKMLFVRLISRTLWEYLHDESILDGLLSPILILDQFEEYFTRGRSERSHEEQYSDLIPSLL